MKVQVSIKQLRDVNGALIAITPFDTTALAWIFNKCATIKLLI